MNLSEVKRILDERFNEQPQSGARRQIIFWYDEEGQFARDIDELELANARILKLHTNNAFHIKYQLEKVDRESNYLLYSPLPRPAARDNWLLDMLKYSTEFSTDKAVLIMRDFGVKDPALANTFRKYLKFFDNKERYKKFASYGLDTLTEDRMHVAVMSVLCRLPAADFESVVRKVLMGETEVQNKYLEAINSFGDLEAYWELAEKRYGYSYEERSLEKLLLMFLVTHLSYSLEEKLPESWQQFLTLQKTDSMIFVDSFMNHAGDSKYYDTLACKAEEILRVKDHITRWDLEKYLECDTFRAFEEAILANLRDSLLEDIGEFTKYRKIINKRRTSHWFAEFQDEYEALYYAVALLEAEKKAGKKITGDTAFEMVHAYTNEYFLLDQYYRKFYLHYDNIGKKEPLAALAEKIENTYTHWFLDELSIKWSEALASELPQGYPLAGVHQQQNFYDDFISSHVRRDERVFVIISDGLRYEAGQELQILLQKELRGTARLSFLQGIVPSTTQMGMAGLLPGNKIEINDRAEVIKDGINTQGTENRRKILVEHSSRAVAIQYQDMVEMKRAEYKKAFEGNRLIFIYHNVIDAIGDDSKTEREVFQAVEKALQELVQLVRNLVNHVSATNIYITADHGFIYRRSPLQESDKVSRQDTEAIAEGRRYILTSAGDDQEGALPISMEYLLGEQTALKAIVPRGVIRYKVQGPGANYVHGGASLQEIIIPLIRFKYVRKDAFKPAKVTVKLTNISRKITNRITFLEFLQTDKVEDKKLPLKLKLYFADADGRRISNENIIIADSRSQQPEERTYREKFTLKEMPYDKSKNYYLVMEDEEGSVEKVYEKIPFVIDLLISDDFTS
jgi:uncharacterized protein (TIGR02687 family)